MRPLRFHRKTVSLLLLLFIVSGILALAFLPRSEQRPKAVTNYHVSVEQGRYLATVANCSSCHTAQGGAPFAGGVVFHTPFGLLYSTNITPDEETGIGGWSFEGFYNAMKHGIRPDGTHLYPAFPFTAFAKMTDKDLAALFVYLKTIPPIRESAKPEALRFPYNRRGLMYFWNLFFHDSNAFEPDPEHSAEWNRGAYLVQGPAHCGACHTPRNFLGAERDQLALSGGVYLDEVRSGEFREWSAVNLTPAMTGLALWSSEDIVTFLQQGQNNRAVVHGPMNEVVMNSTRHLKDSDLRAMATYLKGIPSRAQGLGPRPSEEFMRAGEIGYTVHCGSCHLPTGLGDEALGVPLAGSAIVQAPSPASLLNVILYGPHLPPPPFVVERTRMKTFGKRLSDEDIARIATYVRASFGNEAGAVSPEQVRRQR